MADNPLDPQRLAAMREAVGAFNRARSSAARASTIRLVSAFVPLALIVIVVGSILNGNADAREQWTSPLHVYLYVGALIAGVAGWFWASAPKRRAAEPASDALFPVIFGSIDGFRHAKGEVPVSFTRLPRELVGDFDRKQFDDLVTGAYRGFNFELFEARLGLQGQTAFAGAGLAFEAERPFPGLLVAGLQAPKAKGVFGRIFGGKALEQVLSGNAELDAAYVFATDNASAAAPLLGGALASALNWLRETWPDGRALVALKGSDAFVLLPSERNLFELPQGPQPLDFERDVKPVAVDVYTLLEAAALMRRLV